MTNLCPTWRNSETTAAQAKEQWAKDQNHSRTCLIHLQSPLWTGTRGGTTVSTSWVTTVRRFQAYLHGLLGTSLCGVWGIKMSQGSMHAFIESGSEIKTASFRAKSFPTFLMHFGHPNSSQGRVRLSACFITFTFWSHCNIITLTNNSLQAYNKRIYKLHAQCFYKPLHIH